jgi:hypothetical protein
MPESNGSPVFPQQLYPFESQYFDAARVRRICLAIALAMRHIRRVARPAIRADVPGRTINGEPCTSQQQHAECL